MMQTNTSNALNAVPQQTKQVKYNEGNDAWTKYVQNAVKYEYGKAEEMEGKKE